MNLKNISNDELLSSTKKLSEDERQFTTKILHHLKEIESRRLHLQMGYSSLFEYAVKELKYSEDSAYRRISAMRLLKNLPEIENKINDGSITLAGAAKIQRFIRAQDKENFLIKKEIFATAAMLDTQVSAQQMDAFSIKLETKKDKLTWIETLENKSLQEIEKEIIKLNPETLSQEKIRHITEDKFEIKLIIDEELKNQLDQLKNLLSHKNPNMSYQEVIKHTAQIGLKKLNPTHSFQAQKFKNENESQPIVQRNVSGLTRRLASNSRYVPSTIKQEVYMRDKGCCTYADPKTKRQCTSRHLLQYDHRYPLSLGGETSVNNLRLLCFQHHKYVTENAKEMGL